MVRCRFFGLCRIVAPVMACLLWAAPAAFAEEETASEAAGVSTAEKVTFTKDVAPILYKNCVICHHAGGIGPMGLVDYAEVRNFAPMIKEVVQERRMPPWHADPAHGEFKNARVLTTEEIDTISRWVDGRTPMGDKADLPKIPEFDPNWRMGTPDVVFEMPTEASIQADGEVPYQYYSTPTNFDEDKWVVAAEAKPGNPKVVHHIIVFNGAARTEWGSRDLGLGLGRGYVKGFAPGVEPMILPEGYAMKMPKGSVLIWQMHYTPTGKPETDRSQIAFRFTKEPPKYEFKIGTADNGRFKIPPGEPNHRVDADFKFREDATLLALTPHMHLRGKSFEYAAVFPDGAREILLKVPRYDFNWQMTYEFAKPIFVPQGTVLECTAHFDNSPGNPANPDPSKTVYWGDQTDDEMMIGFFEFVWGRTGDATDRVKVSSAP